MTEPNSKPFSDDLPDVTAAPQVKKHDVDDHFEYDVAFRMGFVGVGQGGGRIAETFFRLGYGRVCAINTAKADLDGIDDKIPKLDLATGGAGKDPEYGRVSVEDRTEMVWDTLTRAIGKKPEYLFVCAGLGGGTGSGAALPVLNVCRSYMEHIGGDPRRVGVILSLPQLDEGPTVCRNAVYAFDKIYKAKPSPMIIIDNQRIEELYSSLGQPVGATKLFPTCNQQVAKLFHLFNRLAVQRNGVMNFDRADYASLLDAGLVAFGASSVPTHDSPADISEAIRKQLGETLLAKVDLSKGKRAGCIFVGSETILGQIPMEFFGGGFNMLNRLLAEGSMVHRGIYQGNTEDLRCYTMVAGLPAPVERLRQMANKAVVRIEGLASFLGVD